MALRPLNRIVSGFIVLALLTVGVRESAAQAIGVADYPKRPVRLIVPFPPGAANDILGRAVGARLSQRLGQSFVVDNRAGAGGVLGTSLAAEAPTDGYTIVLVPASHAINASLLKKPPYDAIRDFAPVSRIATGAYMLVVSPGFPPKTIAELVSLAKSKPGYVNYASAGVGNATHLLGELVASMANIQMTHVPYKGGTPALVDVMAGRAHMYFGTVAATHQLAKSGKVRALAVTSATRARAVPEIPTISESGIPGFDGVGWWGILAPARVPAPIIEKLNREIVAYLSEPETEQWLRRQGFEPAPTTSRAFASFIASEVAKWGKVVAASGATIN